MHILKPQEQQEIKKTTCLSCMEHHITIQRKEILGPIPPQRVSL